MELAGPSEEERDLNSEKLPARLEAGPSEPVKAFARPFVSEPARFTLTERDLYSETLSAGPEAKDIDPARDRKSEACSAKVEDELNESVRVRKSEPCST